VVADLLVVEDPASGRVDPADPELAARIELDGDPGLGAALLQALSITP